MGSFKLVRICDEKGMDQYTGNGSWKPCVLLPCYRERYACFCQSGDLSFEELIKMFFHGNDDDQIGAMSLIAENYPDELYQMICIEQSAFSHKSLKFIFEFVLPDYLPLFLPKEQLTDFEFDKEFSNDIWVRILKKIRSLL